MEAAQKELQSKTDFSESENLSHVNDKRDLQEVRDKLADVEEPYADEENTIEELRHQSPSHSSATSAETRREETSQNFETVPQQYISYKPDTKLTHRRHVNKIRVQPQKKPDDFFTKQTDGRKRNVKLTKQKSVVGRAKLVQQEVNKSNGAEEAPRDALPPAETEETEPAVSTLENNDDTANSGDKAPEIIPLKDRLVFTPQTTKTQLVLGYKSIDQISKPHLKQSWLKWTGCWDAFTFLVQEFLQVTSLTM